MSFIRLHVTTEGPTERSFVKKVLGPYLAKANISTDARAVLTSKDKHTGYEFRGGVSNYQKIKNDIVTWIKEDNHAECRFSTMFDLYGLPKDFPGYEESIKKQNPYEKVRMLEDAFYADINDRRFIPYIQLHEFETLILADPKQLECEYLEHERPIANLCAMVGEQNPELINDGPTTAPSKRILKEITEYKKTTAGVSVVNIIGIAALGKRCCHFSEWLQKLENGDCS